MAADSIPSSFVPSAATSLPSTVPETAMFPVTVAAPVAAVPLVTIFCEPKLGAIFVPAIAADVLTSLLTNEPLVTPTVI